MQVKDFMVDGAADLLIANGDFVVNLSDGQHIGDILISAPGDFKQSPLLGVNLAAYFNAPNSADTFNQLRRSIQLQLESDNYLVNSIDMTNGIQNSEITADRVR